jgi:rhodanese-related sulfurtransferase
MKLNLSYVCITCTIAIGAVSTASADGNRYYFERYYTSEISPAKTYLEMQQGEAVVIDVRRVREYYAGHPYAEDAPPKYDHAYHVPYPHIYVRNEQDPQDFYDGVVEAVKEATGLDPVADAEEFYATPIRTLCRTGARSVRAANILADLYDPLQSNWPQTVEGTPFTNVKNIWEGFVGQYKEAYLGDPDYDSVSDVAKSDRSGLGNKKGVPHLLLDHESQHHLYLDLNNDGILNTDVADVITETKDDNPDKDGWRNYQELPWITVPEDEAGVEKFLYPAADYGPFTPVE